MYDTFVRDVVFYGLAAQAEADRPSSGIEPRWFSRPVAPAKPFFQFRDPALASLGSLGTGVEVRLRLREGRVASTLRICWQCRLYGTRDGCFVRSCGRSCLDN